MRTIQPNKQIENALYIWIDIQGKPVLCGVLQLEDDGEDRFFAQFTYVQSYLNNPVAFALDPINLPLIDAQTTYRTTNRFEVLGAIFDAAPDAWGRNVMRLDNDGTRVKESEVLIKGAGMGVGALLFSTSVPASETVRSNVEVVPPEMEQIGTLADLLADIDAGIKPKGAYRDMLGSSWDMGGARPKVIVKDDGGHLWIAKFPRKGDTFDRQRVEYANLCMALDIGLNVPEIKLAETHKGAVLLSRRFDRQASADGRAQRRHYLSAASLVSPPVDKLKRELDSPRGKAVYSYARLADITRRISSDPIRDLKELYARMILNVSVHNTDDHLKNIGYLKDENSSNYRLSPLFDVVTQEGNAKHYLHIGATGRESSFENALSEYRRFGLRSEGAAISILDRVKDVVGERQRYYDDAGLSAGEIQQIESALSAWHADSQTELLNHRQRMVP